LRGRRNLGEKRVGEFTTNGAIRRNKKHGPATEKEKNRGWDIRQNGGNGGGSSK